MVVVLRDLGEVAIRLMGVVLVVGIVGWDRSELWVGGVMEV